MCGGGRGGGGGYGERVSDRETGRPVGAVALAAPFRERRMRRSEAAVAMEALMRWIGGGGEAVSHSRYRSKQQDYMDCSLKHT